MSDLPQTPIPLIEQLRAWFHPKDRSVQLAPDCWAFMHPTTVLPVDRLTRMPLSLVGIDEKTLTASVAFVNFTGIPQTFRSLVLHCLVRTDSNATDGLFLQFNADAGANYNRQRLRGNNATASANAAAGASGINCGAVDGGNATVGSFSPVIVHVLQYRAATFKAILSETTSFGDGVAANFYRDTSGGNWASTAAVSSIKLSSAAGANFVAGCVFALYGVL